MRYTLYFTCVYHTLPLIPRHALVYWNPFCWRRSMRLDWKPRLKRQSMDPVFRKSRQVDCGTMHRSSANCMPLLTLKRLAWERSTLLTSLWEFSLQLNLPERISQKQYFLVHVDLLASTFPTFLYSPPTWFCFHWSSASWWRKNVLILEQARECMGSIHFPRHLHNW